VDSGFFTLNSPNIVTLHFSGKIPKRRVKATLFEAFVTNKKEVKKL